ncbi:hypothetical protein TcWFU_008541 [Taenia crassiceps]|uniref:Prominin-like protein n=1 Tax=Taenia crassiceps TaxID=6207 RepID=A0ABR4Q3R5_9CEST
MVTSLQSGLLSGATAVFAWAKDVYDCGFLNDFFMVTSNSTIVQRKTSLRQTLMEVIGQNLFSGGRHNLNVYRWLPADLQDGNEASQRVAILTGATILFALLLLLFPLAPLIVSCNCPCCRKRNKADGKSTKQMAAQGSSRQEKEIFQDPYLLEKLHTQALKKSKSSEKSSDRLLIHHVAVFVITFLLLFTLLIMICILFTTGNFVVDILAEDQSTSNSAAFDANNFNLLGGLTYVFAQTLDFLVSGAASGNASSAKFLVQVNSTFMTLLENGVSVAVDDLLQRYGVQQLVQTGSRLQRALDVVKANMKIIRLNNQDVSANISSLVGQFKVYHELIVPELKNACAIDMGAEITALCTSLQNRASILLIQFNASAIKVDTPAVLNFVFNELGVDLSAILNQFNQFTAKIFEVKDQILAQVSTFFDLNSFFSSITQVWSIMDNETAALNDTFIKLTRQLEQGVGTSRPFVYAMIYTPTAILLGILLAYLVIAVLYAIEAKNTKLFYMDEIATNTSSRVCSNRGNLIHAVLFIIFLITTSIFIIVFLPTCVLLVNNGCAYLTDHRGVAQSDYVLNSYMATEVWPPVMEQALTSIKGSAGEFLILPSPKNIINATTVLCGREMRNAPTGLLGAVGWTSFIDVFALLNTKDATNKYIEGEKRVKEKIIALNLASLIPKDLEKIGQTAQNLTQYFDKMDYQPSIDELSPTRLPLTGFNSFADDVEELIQKIRKLGLNVNPILERVASQIRVSLKESLRLKAKIKLLRDAFIAVQTRRNLTVGVNYLVGGIEAVKLIFNNETALLAPVTQVYWQLINKFKVDLDVNLTSVIETFVKELLPCSQLYAASNALLAMFCRQNGGVTRLFTWFYMLAIAVIIATLLCFDLFYLNFMQSHHFRRLQNKPYRRHTLPNSPQGRYIPMSSGNYLPPPSTPSSSSVYHPTPQSQPQQLHDIRLAAPIPPVYEYAKQRDIDLEELSVSHNSMVESEESMENEAPSYQPVPLPRSGRPYLPSTFGEEKDKQEESQHQEQEEKGEEEEERNEDDEIEEAKGNDKVEAKNGEEESQHQISDHEI